MADAPDALLPVLVAELATDDARRQVEALAEARELAFVPLIDAPVDGSLHVLEVMTPGHDAPLLVLAEPMGEPTERGFPVRLHPYDSPPKHRSVPPPPGQFDGSSEAPPPFLPSRLPPRGAHPLSAHHKRDLLGGSDKPEPHRAAPEEMVGRELAGKLRIEGILGVGTLGVTYRARHEQLGTALTVKVLSEQLGGDLDFCAQFQAHALVVSQLDHANIVRVIDYGQEADGHLYLAMERLEGTDLAQVIRRDGPLPLRRILDIAMQISAALGFAHGRGVVHRQLKPSNVIVVKTDDGTGRPANVVKVGDFGVATRLATGQPLGTPAYMSPEQCAGAEVDGRSDIYSLGVVLYELMTGRTPFSADTPSAMLAQQVGPGLRPPSEICAVDSRLEQLVLRMLRRAAFERPQTMRDLRGELRTLMRPPPSLALHEVGAGRADRGSSPPPSSRGPVSSERGYGPDSAARPSQPGAPRSASGDGFSSLTKMEAPIDPRALAAELVREPVATLRARLVAPDRFVAEARTFAAALRAMLEQREHAALAHVITALQAAAEDGSLDPRACELSARLVKTLQDPAILAHAAERALSDHEDGAARVLPALGLAAAHALYAARVRAHPTPPVRGRFVTTMRAIGPAALPLLSTALQRNAPDAAQHDHRLGEDLLRSLPAIADEAAGGIVTKYLRWGDAAVRRAAVASLVVLWGDRARPLLLAVLLKDADEGARVASVRALRDLRAIDEHVVRKAEDIFSETGAPGVTTPTTAVRVAVAEALAETQPNARALAAALLERALRPKGGVFAVLRTRARAAPSLVTHAMAKSLLEVGDAEAPRTVDELARQCEEPLRTQLLALITAKSAQARA